MSKEKEVEKIHLMVERVSINRNGLGLMKASRYVIRLDLG